MIRRASWLATPMVIAILLVAPKPLAAQFIRTTLSATTKCPAYAGADCMSCPGGYDGWRQCQTAFADSAGTAVFTATLRNLGAVACPIGSTLRIQSDGRGRGSAQLLSQSLGWSCATRLDGFPLANGDPSPTILCTSTAPMAGGASSAFTLAVTRDPGIPPGGWAEMSFYTTIPGIDPYGGVAAFVATPNAADAQQFAPGDVIVGGSVYAGGTQEYRGVLLWYGRDGHFKKVLADSEYFGGFNSLEFRTDGTLFGASAPGISTISPSGKISPGPYGSSESSQSIAFASDGKAVTNTAATIKYFSPSGSLISSHPLDSYASVRSLDLAADQCTVFLLGSSVARTTFANGYRSRISRL